MSRMHNVLMGLALMVVATIGGGVGSARADVDVDLGAAINLGDDADLYVAISSRYFGHDPRVVGEWRHRYRDPDDCAVAFFLASHSKAGLDVVFRLHDDGLSWWDIGLRLGVPVDVWFVPVGRMPGPPYGNAYGHWHRHRARANHRFTLSNREVRDLVALRMMHDYYGLSPEKAMKLRASNRSLQSLMSKEYRARHPRHDESAGRADRDTHRGGKSGSSKSHGKGRR